MTRTARLVPDGDGVAACRVRFLSAEPVEPGKVRGAILASWQRSQQQEVLADHIELGFYGRPEADIPLVRSAEPVLQDLRERLDGQPVSIILTDQTGLVLRRLTADHDLERDLDRVNLAPGFSYAEKDVGTNGIGTALEVGAPAQVLGHEHYAENLDRFGCAGVPIRHPVTGRTVGAIDLTCWRRDAGPLLLTLAKTTAEQIRQALLTDVGGEQLTLFREYLRTCRRISGAVFAISGDMVMMNEDARTVLAPTDQAALLTRATEVLAAGLSAPVDVDLPTGLTARLFCRRVLDAGPMAGIAYVGAASTPPQQRRHLTDADADAGPLPSLAGSAPLWRRACHETDLAVATDAWLVLEGEPGVGKLAILRAAHARRQLSGRLVVLDAMDAVNQPEWVDTVRAAVAEERRHIVVRHVDRLDRRRLRALTTTLEQARGPQFDGSPWVAVTMSPDPGNRDLDGLLQLFPRTVEVPPLRLHIDDLPQLLSAFLQALGTGGRLACSPQALHMLMRASWPGNAEELQLVLREVIRHRRTGMIQPEDLPSGLRMLSRRRLSQLESLERDAIVRSLQDVAGNKAKAAQALGMSRATIYRRIYEYGIVVPTS